MLPPALALLFWLLVAHALCDYPLQGDFLSRAKSHREPLPGVPYLIPLLAHALIHGGAVAFVTGSVWLGIAEAMLHGMIDDMKVYGLFGFAVDQALHVACKVLLVVLALHIGVHSPCLPTT